MTQKIAFVFPGQGSQSLGMLGDLASQFPLIKTTFEEASTTLGYDLWVLTQQGPLEKLGETQFTQPALLAAGVACFRLWTELRGPAPIALAGHSLGEYTALTCAESIGFKEALLLVQKRGEYMQAAVPSGEGAMAAIIGLENDAVDEICKDAAEGQVVTAANLNSPGQVVIAGQTEAVTRACALAKEKGAKMTVVLPVSVPSHCDLMRPAAERLVMDLQGLTFQTPKIPVYHNVDAQYHSESEAIKQALLTQLYSPVQWTKTVESLATLGIHTVIECGPGTVLSSLNKRIDKTLENFSIGTVESLEKALIQINL